MEKGMKENNTEYRFFQINVMKMKYLYFLRLRALKF